MLTIDFSFYVIAAVGSVIALVFVYAFLTPGGPKTTKHARPHA